MNKKGRGGDYCRWYSLRLSEHKGAETNLTRYKPVFCLLVLEDAQSVALPVCNIKSKNIDTNKCKSKHPII